jgi:glycosyltransferase involved in cell wall biosynthesis
MEGPLVSVVIAVRNGERFLATAIESVLAQTYHPLEFIVVDGQSSDGTALIAQSFAQVSYILESGSPTVGHGRNLGIDRARGEFISFNSHDDLWLPDKLATQVDYLLQHREVQYTITRLKFFLEPGCFPPSGFRPDWLTGDHPGRIPETMLARRSVFDRIGRFDPNLIVAEDVDWFSRASDQNISMAVIPQVLLHKRLHDSNLSLNPQAGQRDLLMALRQSVARKKGRHAESNS